ncbi:MAG: hypothetical protein PHC48_00985 [Prevotella sp.]|nr:hypothetical protein [Prevotella sp.]
MLYLIFLLIALGLFAALLGYVSQRRHGESPIMEALSGECETCSSSSSLCEQKCLMEAATKPVEYFEDEELDRYVGRPSDSYTEEETQQFAEVLETLRRDEVKAWNRSLILRGINMPDGIKDEFVTLAE